MTLPETSAPIIAAAIVVGIGLLGIAAGVVACRRVFAEGRILDKGEDALTGSLPSLDLDTTDPVTWLASNDLPKDSHFGDHLLSVWCGWLGERVPTLAELHNLSARRERRRLSARISGGITALLLICGIAGTLLCIHPILKAFTIPVNADKEVIIDPMVAQQLIRSLGSAFLPSLAALGFTVLVAILRGMYLQTTTGLAWRLDRFAVSQLFPKFKPKRFGSELTEVHLKLSRLVDRMEERDRDFGEVVGVLGKAALDLKETGPKLKAASDQLTHAVAGLANETESMTKALDTHLGGDSALAQGTRSIKEILGTCVDTARQLQEGGATLAESLAEAFGKFEIARADLGTTVAGIPKQIQQGFDVGSKTLIDASGNLDQAHTRIAGAVAGIPLQIQQGCDLGSKTLIDASLQATEGPVASIARAAESAAAEIKSAAGNVQNDIQTSYANAGEVFTRAAGDASNHAAMAIGQAADAATKSIQAEVEPVTKVAAEMRKQLDAAKISYANVGKDIGSAATEATSHAATAIGQAADTATKSIQAELEPVTKVATEMRQQLDAACTTYANAGKDFSSAATEASNHAATVIGQAASDAVKRIKAEVSPGTQATSGFRNTSNTAKGFASDGRAFTRPATADQATERNTWDATNKGHVETDHPTGTRNHETTDASTQETNAGQSSELISREPVMEDPPKTKLWKRIASLGIIK